MTVKDNAASTMSAVLADRYGGPEVLRTDRHPIPTPGSGEVLLKVQAAGIDRGTWHLLYGLPRIARLATGITRPRRPIHGLDVAGVVAAVGAGVTSPRIGEEVFGISKGSLAEYAIARVDKLAPASTRLSPTESATLGVSGITAMQALDAAALNPGDHILITGASGGVGSYAVQLAAARGLAVTAVCSAPKAETVMSWGATKVLDRQSADPTTGTARFAAVIDIAGGRRAREWKRVLTPGGTVVFVGDDSGGSWTGGYFRPLRETLAARLRRGRSGQARHVMLVSNEKGDSLHRLAQLVDQGVVTPHIHSVESDAASAIRLLESGTVTGKIAVLPPRSTT